MNNFLTGLENAIQNLEGFHLGFGSGSNKNNLTNFEIFFEDDEKVKQNFNFKTIESVLNTIIIFMNSKVKSFSLFFYRF